MNDDDFFSFFGDGDGDFGGSEVCRKTTVNQRRIRSLKVPNVQIFVFA